MSLFALIGVHICEKAPSVKKADEGLAISICWFAIRTDAAKWFEGHWCNLIDPAPQYAWIPWLGYGYLGRLAPEKIRKALYVAPEFMPYWIARQHLAERLGAQRPEYKGYLSPIVPKPAGTRVAYNILPIPPDDELISYILELSPAFGLRFDDPDLEISLDLPPDEENAQMKLECEVLMTQAAILAGAPDPEDHKGARTFLFNRLRAPGQLWLLNLPLAVADLLKHLKKINALSRPAPAAPPITEPEPSAEPPNRAGSKGDAGLLGENRLVTGKTAEQYLGVGERQLRNLKKSGALTVEGKGSNQRITTESLREYLPPHPQK
jgi:hypothetical protein